MEKWKNERKWPILAPPDTISRGGIGRPPGDDAFNKKEWNGFLERQPRKGLRKVHERGSTTVRTYYYYLYVEDLFCRRWWSGHCNCDRNNNLMESQWQASSWFQQTKHERQVIKKVLARRTMNPSIASHHLRLHTWRSFPSTLRNLHVSQDQVWFYYCTCNWCAALSNFWEGELEMVFFNYGRFFFFFFVCGNFF